MRAEFPATNRRSPVGAVIVAIGATAVWACGSEPEETHNPPEWTVHDSAGVTVVSNHSDAVAPGCATVIANPLTTIRSGTERGDVNPPLYDVRGAAVLGDSRIVVLNTGSQELFFYDAAGPYQYAVGGSGRGPGEFIKPTWLGQGDNDTLFVWDSGLSRLSTFNGTGELIASHQIQADDWRDMPGAIEGRFDNGLFFVRPASLVFFGGETGVVRPRESYGWFDLENLNLERLVVGSGSEAVVGEGPVYELPFGKTDIAVAHGDAVVIGDDGTSVLRYYDLDGRLHRVVKWLTHPIPITDRDRRAYRRYIARIFRPAFARLYDNARFARARPRFSSIASDPTGWLWVRSYAASWEPLGHWWLFDEAGILRCTADTPATFRPLQIGERHILGTQRDESDDVSVVLLTLVRR